MGPRGSPSMLSSHTSGAFLGVRTHAEWRLRSPPGDTRFSQDLRVLPSTAARRPRQRGREADPGPARGQGATHVGDPGPPALETSHGDVVSHTVLITVCLTRRGAAPGRRG